MGFPLSFSNSFGISSDELHIFFFNEFHENGVITKELGASFISLIPKKVGSFSLKDFRPISLIGSIFKIG